MASWWHSALKSVLGGWKPMVVYRGKNTRWDRIDMILFESMFGPDAYVWKKDNAAAQQQVQATEG